MKKYLLLLLFCTTAQASIVHVPAPPPSDYPTLTHNQVIAGSTQLFNSIKNFLAQAYRAAWNDPKHPNGTDYFAALGTDCAQAHGAYLYFVAGLNNLVSGSVPATEPCVVTPVADGTCNVACPQPAPSPSTGP